MHMHAWTAAYPTAAAEHAPTHAGVGFALCSLRQHGARYTVAFNLLHLLYIRCAAVSSGMGLRWACARALQHSAATSPGGRVYALLGWSVSHLRLL